MAREAPFLERTSRRAAILRGRLIRTLPGAAPRHRSLFLHLPKCGGTSLAEAMYATIPASQRIGVIDALSTRRAAAMLQFDRDDPRLCHEDLDQGQMVFDLREAMLLQHMAWDTMLIHGHVLWSDRAQKVFGRSYKVVTLMRDPVARTLSNFRMSQRTGVTDGGLQAYLDGPAARRQARVYLRYLSGQNDIADGDLDAAVDLAKSRLEDCALIGFLEDLGDFQRRYRQLFGVHLRIGRLNAAPKQDKLYNPDLLDRIKTLCAPDIEIHEHARKIVAGL